MPLAIIEAAPTIASDGRIHVAATCYEIMFRDGSSIGLHQVWHAGAPALLLRALRFAQSLIVFDLANVHRELANELPMAATRDVPGLVFYSLRTKFANADQLVAHVLKAQRAALPCPEMAVAA